MTTACFVFENSRQPSVWIVRLVSVSVAIRVDWDDIHGNWYSLRSALMPQVGAGNLACTTSGRWMRLHSLSNLRVFPYFWFENWYDSTKGVFYVINGLHNDSKYTGQSSGSLAIWWIGQKNGECRVIEQKTQRMSVQHRFYMTSISRPRFNCRFGVYQHKLCHVLFSNTKDEASTER